MDPLKTGSETSEWKAWLVTICGALALGLGAVLSSALIPEGTTLYVVLGVLATVLAAIGGVTISYNKGRANIKAASAAANVDVANLVQTAAQRMIDSGAIGGTPQQNPPSNLPNP